VLYFSHAGAVDYNRRFPLVVDIRRRSTGSEFEAAIVRVSTMQSNFARTSSAVLAVVLLLLPNALPAAISWDFTINDPGATYQAYYTPIESNLTAALAEWSSHLVSNVPSSIQIEISFASSVTRSTGYSATSVFVNNVGGVNVFEQSVANEIRTGADPNGIMPDLYLKFEPSYLSGELWFDPNPQTRNSPVPADKTDAYSVLLHELAHAIGFNGWRDSTTAAVPGSPPYESTFDQGETFDGSNLYFNGPSAKAVYGGPVPVTYGNNWHIGNSAPRPGSDLIPDLMNGVVFFRGTRYDISPLDLAILSDAGVATSPGFIRGDFNNDGHVTAADISTMLAALVDLNAYKTAHRLSDADLLLIGDIDGSGALTNGDLNALIGLLRTGGGSIASVPEPASLVQVAAGVLLLLLDWGWAKTSRMYLYGAGE
jgi:hypothetical protein